MTPFPESGFKKLETFWLMHGDVTDNALIITDGTDSTLKNSKQLVDAAAESHLLPLESLKK